MKETTITIRTYDCERSTQEERGVTAYTDDRFPGLAIHGPWELGTDEWRVTHIPSGLIVATLPTRAAATAALETIAKLQDWNRPQANVIPVEPGERTWLKANIATAVHEVKRERAAALAQAVEMGTIKATALEAALGDFRCQKMRRAWRTRSNCTHGDWTKRAANLLKRDAGLDEVWRLAAALYAAASDFSPGGLFAPAAWPPFTWKQLSGRLRTYRAELPEKALSRGQYEAKRRAAHSA
jgi:hypothetical protein